MNIHKLNSKPKTIPPKTIQWCLLREVKYQAQKVNPMTWEIFSQEGIKLDPKEVKQILLGFGFKMSEGVVLAGLSNSLKYRRCSLQNGVSLKDVEDIVITHNRQVQRKKITFKAEKHEKIKMILSTKLTTIASHISKALSDNKVTDEEFRLILKELEKYKVMKEEVRTKTKKKIANETEESLIERGRQEAREYFRKLVEKSHSGPVNAEL